MTRQPQIRPPGGLAAPVLGCTGLEAELPLEAVLQTLREIVAGLDRLEARLDASEIPKAATARGSCPQRGDVILANDKGADLMYQRDAGNEHVASNKYVRLFNPVIRRNEPEFCRHFVATFWTLP